MPSSKDPIINRQKAKEYRLAHPEWHRRTTREWARKKRQRLGPDGLALRLKERKLKDPIGYFLEHAKKRARRQGVPFDLARKDLVMPEVCPVFGVPFEWGSRERGWRNMWAPSLDRIKPQLGYVRDNINIISNRANHLKSNGTISEFRAVIKYMIHEGCNETLKEQELALAFALIPSPQLDLF